MILKIEKKSNDEDGIGSIFPREPEEGGSPVNVSKTPITSELKSPKQDASRGFRVGYVNA